MSELCAISLDTSVMTLYELGIPRLSQTQARKLALALGAVVGKKNAEDVTVEDLLSYLPTRYEDRSSLTRINHLYDGLDASLELYVRVSGGFQVGKNRGPHQPRLFIFEITASDPEQTGKPVVVWWFVSGSNAPRILNYYKEKLSRGARFIAFGKWTWDDRRKTYSLRLGKPDELEILPGTWTRPRVDFSRRSITHLKVFQRNKSASFLRRRTCQHQAPSRIRLILKMQPNQVQKQYTSDGEFPFIANSASFGRRVCEQSSTLFSPGLMKNQSPRLYRYSLCSRYRLINRVEAWRRIHFPTESDSLSEYEKARSPAHMRLIFEEFFWITLALGLRRGERMKEPKGATIRISEATRSSIASVLPFTLTGAQNRVMEEVFADMQSNAPMNRLLQGDVGSGKTIVALQAMLAALENGYQTALMVPTEILAEQHSRYIKRLLANTPFRVEVLIGSLRASEKRRVQTAIAEGDVRAVVGTHTLIQDAVTFSKLGLIVIDEQHRFGVLQRAELRDRGFHPDVLVMTATPIPRSLAMTAYGDLDVSIIDELPPGRTPIKTVVVGEDRRIGVYKGVEREVRAGRQVYVVYPLVDESEKMDLKDATRMFEQLRNRVFPNFTIGLLHGKMKGPEKEEVMRRFISGEIQILVATTVVEVGIDVPNASLMIIEHAERFGLSQLHQLRGRVGRGAEQSFCVLLASDKQTIVARERLGIMEETSDGFRIAEKDLEIRGPGEIMGTRQSGIPNFRIGNLVRDIQILEKARREADFYLALERQVR